MKRIKTVCFTGVVLLLCVAGLFHTSSAFSKKRASSGKVYLFNRAKEQLPVIHSVEADLDSVDFKIKATKEQKSYLSWQIGCKNSKNPFSYQVKDGVLYLKESGLKNLSNKEREQIYGKKWWEHYPVVTLYVPVKAVVKSSRIKQDYGDLGIGKNVHCKNMDVQMDCGDIALSAFYVSGTVKINSKAGDIAAAGPNVSGNMQVTAKYGDVAAVGLKVSGNLKITSDGGDIVAQVDKKYFKSMAVTASAEDGAMVVLGTGWTGKKKKKGYGWYYQKNGTGKGKLEIMTKNGDIVLK